jgi:hypothetical protein
MIVTDMYSFPQFGGNQTSYISVYNLNALLCNNDEYPAILWEETEYPQTEEVQRQRRIHFCPETSYLDRLVGSSRVQ